MSSSFSSRRRHTRLQGDWSSDVCSFYPSRRRHTRLQGDWSSDVCSSDPSRRRHTRLQGDWSSDVCSSDLLLRSEEHTSELQSPWNHVCRLLLEKKKSNHFVSHSRASRGPRDTQGPHPAY